MRTLGALGTLALGTPTPETPKMRGLTVASALPLRADLTLQ